MAGLVIAHRNDTVEWYSVNRGSSGAPYDRRQLSGLESLVPHLRRASEASYRLAQAHANHIAWETALDALKHGVILLNRRGHVVFANQQARRLDAARDGLSLHDDGVSAPHAADALARAIHLATAGDGDGARPGAHVALPRRAAPCPLSASVIPLPADPSWHFPGVPIVLLLVVDPAQPAGADADTLMALFGLTAREAVLTVLLATGRRLDDAAAQLGIGHETARTHVARALDKTGTARQADLVRVALAAAPPIAASPPRSSPPRSSPPRS